MALPTLARRGSRPRPVPASFPKPCLLAWVFLQFPELLSHTLAVNNVEKVDGIAGQAGSGATRAPRSSLEQAPYTAAPCAAAVVAACLY